MTAQLAVRAWLDELAHDAANAPSLHLSTQGMAAALAACLQSLNDTALKAIEDLDGPSWQSASIIAPRTVPTAPIEWLAGWLLRGTRVTWKHPDGASGFAQWAAHHAQRQGLPLTVTTSREAALDAQVIVVMGSDETLRAVQQQVPHHPHVVGFGHRISLAWWGETDLDAAALAHDLLLHDGRGCMTPSLILTNRPAEHVYNTLVGPLTELAHALPAGQISAAEHASRRQRTLLAKALGQSHRVVDVDVHLMPMTDASVAPLPRAVTIVACPDCDTAMTWLLPLRHHISTIVHADKGQDLAWARLSPQARRCQAGQAQRPPWPRDHDGTPVIGVLTQG